MLRSGKMLWQDEAGFVLSAELVLVMTVAVLAMVVGLHAVAKAVTTELNDVANAFGTLDQSFSYKGLVKAHHASVAGAAFIDRADDCDCTVIIQPAPRPKVDHSGWMAENGD
ncbi:MAG: hypothetical protein KDA79_00100 [Planctomycetaceae bacterium]|nr:hypothetical protein [Planctomycetaceae bacterium]